MVIKNSSKYNKELFKSRTYKQRIENCDIENHQIEDTSNVIDMISKRGSNKNKRSYREFAKSSKGSNTIKILQ